MGCAPFIPPLLVAGITSPLGLAIRTAYSSCKSVMPPVIPVRATQSDGLSVSHQGYCTGGHVPTSMCMGGYCLPGFTSPLSGWRVSGIGDGGLALPRATCALEGTATACPCYPVRVQCAPSVEGDPARSSGSVNRLSQAYEICNPILQKSEYLVPVFGELSGSALWASRYTRWTDPSERCPQWASHLGLLAAYYVKRSNGGAYMPLGQYSCGLRGSSPTILAHKGLWVLCIAPYPPCIARYGGRIFC